MIYCIVKVSFVSQSTIQVDKIASIPPIIRSITEASGLRNKTSASLSNCLYLINLYEHQQSDINKVSDMGSHRPQF